MDKLYEEFTKNLLPKIQEGLVISKEYFTDLFGRYIKYLIVQDLIYVAIFFTITALIGFGAYKMK